MAIVERILIRATANGPSVELDRAAVAPGAAIAGDRYANGSGTFYEAGKDGQDVTLVEAEALEATGLSAEDSGRNVVTRGIGLNDLVGRRFRVAQKSGGHPCAISSAAAACARTSSSPARSPRATRSRSCRADPD